MSEEASEGVSTAPGAGVVAHCPQCAEWQKRGFERCVHCQAARRPLGFTISANAGSQAQWAALRQLVESIPGMEPALRQFTYARGPWAQCTALLVWACATGYGFQHHTPGDQTV